jgi:NTE family protein
MVTSKKKKATVKAARKQEQKTINLALQGGGSHGAFAWGVIDQIIEDGRLNIEGLCATSAGTMNACAYAYGKFTGGPEKAREVLHDFWWNIHKAGQQYSPIKRLPWENRAFAGSNPWAGDSSLGFFLFDVMTRFFSPYQFNPYDFNPLRDVLSRTVDFETLRKCDCTKLFISATHVKTGKVRVFNASEMTLDVAMASACLPYLFKAVEVEGEHYWDGGYMGNPALFPLFYETGTRDLMIVHINPIERKDVPDTAHEIMNRVNEISFNSSLISEIRAIAFVKKLLENNMLRDEYCGNFKNILVHAIRADEIMKDYSVGSKFDSDWSFLTTLRDKGKAAMAGWLDENFDKIGVTDTVDLYGEYLQSINNKAFEKKPKVASR